MSKAYCFILILLISSLGATAQDLVGKITDADSAATVLYQAEVTQSQGDKVIGVYKTYFDGTFHIKVKANQTYQIKASYPGRRDSTVTISVDKNGTLYKGTLFISLHKDGLRLMGYVIDRDQDIPIKDAGILIRNVMTRKEDKYITDVNGYYNLKMDFETNYTFRIDKRSPGIVNRYQDTSFNISTIGFNQPLDFKLDIKLGPAAGVTTARPGYDPYAKPDNKNLKPVVEVYGMKDSTKIREQAAALAELEHKLTGKDSVIASLDKRINDINQAKKDQATALNAANEQKKKDQDAAAKQKAEQDLKTKMEEQKKKDEEAAAILRGEQEKNHREEELKAKQQAENERKEKEEAEKVRKEEEEIALIRQEKEKLQLQQEEEKRKADEALLAKQQTATDQKNKADQARANKENAAIAKADSAIAADKQKKEQKERELAAAKKAHDDELAKALRDKEAKTRSARKEAKRKARELAEENKLLREAEAIARKRAETQRIAMRKSQSQKEQHDLEAKKEKEEQERKSLIQQRDQILRDQQASTKKNKAKEVATVTPPAKTNPDNNEKTTIAYWEQKVKDEKGKKAGATATSPNVDKDRAVKVVKTRGMVKSSQTEEALANVSINIRRLNSVVSQEVTSDNQGRYEFLVDSGYFYLVSFYKDKYEISKQILDLTSYTKPEYTMMTQFLKEHDEFDPSLKMPVIQFQRNSSKLPTGLYDDMEDIINMMKQIPELRIKLYGLASADEDYPMELGITRARLVADILLENGIKPNRIRINGIGDFKPRSGCVEGKACTQEQYQRDRVVVYKVIKE